MRPFLSAPSSMPFFALTHHAEKRKCQRGITDIEIALAIRYGKRYWKQGKQIYFLGRRTMPSGLDHQVSERAEGTVVILSQDGAVCTVFRDRDYPRQLRYCAH